MKKNGILLALFVLSAVVISGCIKGEENSPANMQDPRENSEGNVQITATYLPDVTDATAFEISVTAHMDYNDDFMNNSYLRDSSGKTYQALSYEGSSGHHAKGVLRFPKIESKKFDLVIKDVAGVNEKVFTW